GEDAVVGVGAARGEGVEQGALARVGVADEAGSEMLAAALADTAALAGLDLLQLALELVAPALDQPPVEFELLLARPARADTADTAVADDALQVAPHRPPPRVGVLELGEFHLQLRLVRGRAAGEDV